MINRDPLEIEFDKQLARLGDAIDKYMKNESYYVRLLATAAASEFIRDLEIGHRKKALLQNKYQYFLKDLKREIIRQNRPSSERLNLRNIDISRNGF